MEPDAGVYRLESESRAGEATGALNEIFRADAPRRARIRLEFLDTDDRRIERAKGRLAWVRADGRTVLEWEQERGGPSLRCPLETRPAFAWDLPRGPLRDALGRRVEVRRLLPVVEVRLDCRTLDLRDGRGKVVVRCRIEKGTTVDPRAPRRSRRMELVLRVLPVRGYDGARKRVVRLLEKRLGFRRAEPCVRARAFAVLKIEPPAPTPKPGDGLRRGMRCDDAMKILLRALLAAMRRNEEGAAANLDTEFLHDFRVAGRRTRSALGQVPDLFPRAVLDRYRRDFSWLGEVTGPLRDLDVMLLALPGFRAWLPEPLRAGLLPLGDELERRHRDAHRRFVSALKSARYRRMVDGWEAFLDRPVPGRTRLANAMRPVEQVAVERIARAHEKVLTRGRSIDDDSPARKLHRLRIDCKKLRYLLEFFRRLFPGDGLARPISSLKTLQNNLGEFNDLIVTQRVLRGQLDGDGDQRLTGGTGAKALRMLVGLLADRQAEVRGEFRRRFQVFESDPEVARLGSPSEEAGP